MCLPFINITFMKTLVPILFFLIFAEQASAIDRYPEWFLFPQKYPEIITGYSYSGNSAVFDAENMYCAYRSCVVYGTLEIYNDPDRNEWLKNSDYYYYFSPDSVERIHGRLVRLDSFQTELITGDYIAAFSLSPSDSQWHTPWIDARDLQVPAWINKTFWQDDRYYYGVGMYTATGNENDGWKTAEEQGIFTILTNLAVGVYKLRLADRQLKEQQSSMYEISFLHLRFLLNHIEIVQRYPDLRNQLFYVLVRIPRKDVFSPMMGR